MQLNMTIIIETGFHYYFYVTIKYKIDKKKMKYL